MHNIKKYANRKLYDTTDKRYISLDQLAQLIKDGEEVSIIDNQTGEDITSAIISQLLARSKKTDNDLPPSVLVQLLRKGGGTLSEYAKKYSHLWHSALTLAEDEVDKLVGLLVKNKEISASDGSRLKKEIVGYADNLKRWTSDTVDRRLKEILGATNLATRDQMSKLTETIETLTRKVGDLEHQLARQAADAEKASKKPSGDAEAS